MFLNIVSFYRREKTDVSSMKPYDRHRFNNTCVINDTYQKMCVSTRNIDSLRATL